LACGKAADGPVRSLVQHLPLIDAGAGQQVLHPVRRWVPGCLGHRPAVVIIQFRQQAVHHIAAGQAGFPPGEARRDPPHQLIEQPPMHAMIYRGTSGCCLIVVFHKPTG
jgi:hypothetical protein